jgi:negative regulator of replication initiation
MLKTIQIDEGVYEFLRQNRDLRLIECPKCDGITQSEKMYIIDGKTVHLLKCSHFLVQNGTYGSVENNLPLESGSITRDDLEAETCAGGLESNLMLFIADKVFLCKNGTDKYLGILSFAFKDKGEKFDELLKLSGRRRAFFGRSREQIEMSGTSTHPRPIPGSGYWAMTNADSTQKRQMLTKALRVLGYPPEEIQAAAKII